MEHEDTLTAAGETAIKPQALSPPNGKRRITLPLSFSDAKHVQCDVQPDAPPNSHTQAGDHPPSPHSQAPAKSHSDPKRTAAGETAQLNSISPSTGKIQSPSTGHSPAHVSPHVLQAGPKDRPHPKPAPHIVPKLNETPTKLKDERKSSQPASPTLKRQNKAPAMPWPPERDQHRGGISSTSPPTGPFPLLSVSDSRDSSLTSQADQQSFLTSSSSSSSLTSNSLTSNNPQHSDTSLPPTEHTQDSERTNKGRKRLLNDEDHTGHTEIERRGARRTHGAKMYARAVARSSPQPPPPPYKFPSSSPHITHHPPSSKPAKTHAPLPK